MSERRQLFLIFVGPLNRLQISYMVTGSAASMAYGQPRVTLDIDLVVELSGVQVDLLASAFSFPGFYCPSRDVLRAETERSLRGHFNVIHMDSGFKADFYPVGEDPLHRWGMAHRRRVDMLGQPVMLAPPEYVILRKLEYFREGGSEKHLRDIRGMLDVSGDLIQWPELRERIRGSQLAKAWARVEELRL